MTSTASFCIAFVMIFLMQSAQTQDECRDSSEGCQIFKQRNLCEVFKSKLLDQCPMTCGWCAELNIPEEEPCRDTYSACNNVIPYCTPRYRSFLENLCKRTCKWCEGQQAPPVPRWDVPTECSKTCGNGTRYRVPRCSSNNIDTCPKVYEECNMGPCQAVTCQNKQVHRYRDQTSCCQKARHNRCGVPQRVRGVIGRVIGGRIANVRLWSWMVRIDIDIGGGEGGLCGGSLIDPQWVVTAAHCVSPFQLHQLTVSVAYGTRYQRRLSVETMHVHPDFSFPRADIAILKLSSKVQYSAYIQPLCLPRGEIASPEITCYAAGWGQTESGNLSDDLLEVGLSKLPLGVCQEAYRTERYAEHINSRTICAGRLGGGVDTCLGDSGGPLMCQRCSSCEWYLAGITSFGPEQCGQAGQPGLYVNVASFEGWIIQYVTPTQRRTYSCR